MADFRKSMRSGGIVLQRISHSSGVYCWYDTQDGSLFKQSLRLIETNGTRQVYKKGISTPKKSRNCSQCTGEKELLLHLTGKKTESIYTVLHRNHPAGILIIQTWMVEHPIISGQKQTLMRFELTASRRDEHIVAAMAAMGQSCKSADDTTDIFEAGLAALGLPLPGAPLPVEFTVMPGDTVLQVGRKILNRQAYKMRANTLGTIQARDPEYLHDLRVATRRARFGLKLLELYAGEEVCERLRGELQWIASLLGTVRDLDVFINRVEHQLRETDAEETICRTIVGMLEEQRVPAQESLAGALQSPRYELLIKDIQECIPEDSAQKAVPAREVASPIIMNAIAKLKRWQKYRSSDFTALRLHQLRISFKKLRYTCEYFNGIYEGRMEKAIRSCEAFQDCLGTHQDAYIAVRRLMTLAGPLAADEHQSLPRILTLGALMQIQRNIMSNEQALFMSLWSDFPKHVRKLTATLCS